MITLISKHQFGYMLGRRSTEKSIYLRRQLMKNFGEKDIQMALIGIGEAYGRVVKGECGVFKKESNYWLKLCENMRLEL